MAQHKSSKLVYILAFLLLGAGLGYLLYSGLHSNSLYFLHVQEAIAKGTSNIGKARLFGTVSPQGMEKAEESTSIRFQLADKDNPSKTIWIHYQGAVPDTFQAGSEVIVEGRMSGEQQFTAHTLMTKCPSKYTNR